MATRGKKGDGLARTTPVLAGVGVALVLAGCSKFSPDAGMLTVQAAVGAELGKDVVKIGDEQDAAAVSARVKGLLARPLTASSAVQIALLNNRGLQAAY